LTAKVERQEPRAAEIAGQWRAQSIFTQSDAVLGGTVRATCAQQGRNLFAFLIDAVRAAWLEQPPPLIFCVP